MPKNSWPTLSFLPDLSEKLCARRIADTKAKGDRVWLTCRVLDGDSVPVDDCMVEIWQADADGHYSSADDPRSNHVDLECSGFGRMGTNEDGTCEFEAINRDVFLDPGTRYRRRRI